MFFDRGLSPVLENGHFVAKKIEANYITSDAEPQKITQDVRSLIERVSYRV